MIEASLDIPASPANVFAVLADGWSYAGWVVGNSHVREVDDSWPDAGTRIHHSAGAWPFQIHDHTTVRSVEPERFLELEVRLWYFGAAVVKMSLYPLNDGILTRVVMAEQLVGGPAGLIPVPVQRFLLGPRNDESLARLGDLAAGRAKRSNGADPRSG